MRIFLITISIILFCTQLKAEEPQDSITLEKVVNSAVKNYPKVLALYQEVEAAKGSILANQGFFDIRLRQSVTDKSRGFYDGKQTDTEIVKQNQFLGSEIYGGYRKSFGSFENHETGIQTNRDGEFRAGARFSLLRNSMFDENRLSLALSRLDLESSKQAVFNIKNEIRRDATKAYYDWLILGKIHEIYQELYDLAFDRNEQLKIRVRKGDLARIILVENERNLLSRKTLAIKALQDFENSALYLSLFYRDDNGQPIIAKTSQMPKITLDTSLKEIAIQNLDQDTLKALQNRADINIIKISKQKELSNLRQAKNLYKPRLDLDFAVSNDVSNENQFRGQSKNEINLQFEIPLQQRKARGETIKAEAKIEKIQHEERLLQDSIKVTLNQLKNNINSISQMHENLTKETKLSEHLERAERKRFSKGGGDFFLINMREQDTATAKIKNNLIFAKYYKALADYKAEAFIE